jgi:hypothetical protein
VRKPTVLPAGNRRLIFVGAAGAAESRPVRFRPNRFEYKAGSSRQCEVLRLALLNGSRTTRFFGGWPTRE